MAELRLVEVDERGDYAPDLRDDVTVYTDGRHPGIDELRRLAEAAEAHAAWLRDVMDRAFEVEGMTPDGFEQHGIRIDIDTKGSRATITVTGAEREEAKG